MMKKTKKLFPALLIFILLFQVSLLNVNGATSSTVVKNTGIRVTKVKASLNSGVYYYPMVEGINNPKFEKIKNAFNKKVKNELLSLNNDETSALNGTFTINYFNGTILAFRFVGDSFTPDTAHPNKLDVVFHYDLNSGKLYKLADLFKEKIDFETQIKSIVKKNDKAFRSKSKELYADWSYEDFETAWSETEAYFEINQQNGLTAYFFLGNAPGFANGYDIPFTSLKNIVNLQGSFYKAIIAGKPKKVDNQKSGKPIDLFY